MSFAAYWSLRRGADTVMSRANLFLLEVRLTLVWIPEMQCDLHGNWRC